MPVVLAEKASDLLGKHPAGSGLLEGGRNSLLESAQEATLTSVSMAGLARQSNRLAKTRRTPPYNEVFTSADAKAMELRISRPLWISSFFELRSAISGGVHGETWLSSPGNISILRQNWRLQDCWPHKVA